LEVHASASRYAFHVQRDGRMTSLGSLPSRALSAETHDATGTMCFTGACIGPYATGNGRPSSVPADFDWFEYAPDP
jgi:alpha-N-arabinofuranosidase